MLRSGFLASSRGWLPRAEPPAVLYKGLRLDGWRGEEDLDPQLKALFRTR